MPTSKPRVQGYVSQDVLDKLEEFKDAHSLKSTSEAVTLALENYFGIKQLTSDSLVTQGDLPSDLLVAQGNSLVTHPDSLRLDNLEKQMASLSQELGRVIQAIAKLESKSLATQGDLLGESPMDQSNLPSNSLVTHSDLPMSKSNSPVAQGDSLSTDSDKDTPVLSQAGQGLKLAELAARLGRNYSWLRGKKAELGIDSFLEFLQAETGHPWRFDPTAHRYGLFYPDCR